MNEFNTRPYLWLHAPRAIVVFSGLYIFHQLSGDALTSWSLVGLATLAMLARITGSLASRSTRIELSIAATACVLVFVQGGFIDHFNSLSLPLILSIGLLLVGLNTLNVSVPQARIAVVPILLILFFASQRYFYPNLTSEFSHPILAILLLAAAWELLSSLIHAKQNSPSIIETGSTLALLFLYYNQTADFPMVASLATVVLMAFFYGASRSLDVSDHPIDSTVTVKLQRGTLDNRQVLKPYFFLFMAGFSIFLLTAWGIFTQAPKFPFLASLETPPKTLEIEQRNRFEQAFLSFESPEMDVPKPLKPLNISILEDALKQTIKNEPSAGYRKVVIRKKKGSDKLNVGDRDREKVETTRILKIPSLRISPVESSQSLPGYTLSAEIDAGTTQSSAQPIQYDFGFDSQSIESAARTDPSETIELGSAGGPIRLDPSTPFAASQPSRTRSRGQTAETQDSSNFRAPDAQTSVGFSTQLKFASDVSIELETRAVMEVYLPGSAKWMSSLYLRFNTLEEIENDRFVQSKEPLNSSVIIDQPNWNDAPNSFRSYLDSEPTWTVALGFELNDWVPVLGPFESIRFPADQTFSANEASFSMHRVSGSGPFAYQLRGLQITDTWSAEPYTLSDSERERLTRLPLSSKEFSYLKRLGSRIGGNNPSSATFARKAGYYFERVHPYAFDFDFRSTDENLLISWLKARSPGICGYYAGAFTLLARAQGIPARVVVGALTREFDPKSRKFIVRDRDAHAWAEYLNEENQWVRADLTPIALDSSRFTAKESESKVYAHNIQSALTSLEQKSAESSETQFEQETISTQEPVYASAHPESGPDLLTQEKIIPSTANLIDKVLEKEETTVSDILEITSTLAAERPAPSMGTTSPPIEVDTQPTLEIKGKQTITHEITEPMVSETTGTTVSANETQTWGLPSRVVINYLFVLLLAVFTFSQLKRIRQKISKPEGFKDSPLFHDRTRAGRLLQEIESRIGVSRDSSDLLSQIHQSALQLRYSSECSTTEIEALKQKYRRTLKAMQSRS